MIASIESIKDHLSVYFRYHPANRKFDSQSNRAEIIRRVQSYRVTPSETAIYRALKELTEEGVINRVDGGNAKTDAAARAAAEQARIDRLASAPLTDTDYMNFAGMSESQIRDAFYSDPVFAARYRKAHERWGFNIPNPINEPTVDLGQWKDFDARAYNAMPASLVVRTYKSDSLFKLAVDKLVAEGRI